MEATPRLSMGTLAGCKKTPQGLVTRDEAGRAASHKARDRSPPIGDHSTAAAALEGVLSSTTTVLHPDETDFEATVEQFTRYDVHDISFTDNMGAVLASCVDVDHVVTFDADTFRILGMTAVPADTGLVND